MSKVISVGTCDAPYKLSQGEIKSFVHNLFADSGISIENMMSVFDNSKISERHITIPIEWLGKNHTFPERNQLYVENAVIMSEKAIISCLSKIDADYSDIDHIIFISSTGLSTPSVDALLFNRLKLNNHIKRSPIWGLGCAGGAVGISRAYDYTRAFPGENVLLVAVELCSLTFQKDDLSKSNIIATSLFSDGAAAAIVSGKENKLFTNNGINLIDTFSTTYDNSIDVMGWDVIDSGFRVIFRRDIPAIVSESVEPNIKELLDKHNLKVSNIKCYITHPGGLKVINAYKESLGLTNGALRYSMKVLNEHGNMSSPSVLYVLKEFLDEDKYNKGEYGLISALGPGFSSEIILFIT